MKVVYTDVLVIGGGLAGLRIAIGAKRRGHDAIILSLVPAKRSHSKAAQGGMQASLGNVIKGQGDNEDVHFEDTVRGSDWGADQEVVRMFVNTAPKAVRELAAWGVPWSRVRRGDRDVIINGQKVTITERDEAHGTGRAARLRRHQEVAHLLRVRRHGPRDAQRGRRPGDRGVDPGARAHRGDRADPRRRPLLRRHRARPHHRRARRLRREGDRDHHGRGRAAVSRHDQRRHLRGHGPRHRARDRRVRARQHGGGAVPPDRHLPRRHPRDRGLPRRRRAAQGRRRPSLHARLRAGEEGARLARRGVAAHGGAHPQGQGRQEPLRRAPLARHHAARRAPHPAQPARGLRDLPLLPRAGPDEGVDPGPPGPALHDGRRAHQPARARARPSRACSPRARPRAGTCTASTGSAATRSPRPSSPA